MQLPQRLSRLPMHHFPGKESCPLALYISLGGWSASVDTRQTSSVSEVQQEAAALALLQKKRRSAQLQKEVKPYTKRGGCKPASPEVRIEIARRGGLARGKQRRLEKEKLRFSPTE